MKITIFMGSLYGGGAERVACELASYLSRQDYSVEILTVSKTANHYFVEQKVTVKTLEKGKRSKIKLFRVLGKMFRLYKYLKISTADIYVVLLPQTIRSLLFFKKIIHVPIVVSERSDPASYPKSVLKRLCKLYSLSDGIVFLTEQSKLYISNLISKMPNAAVIPNAVNNMEDNFCSQDRNRNTIIAVGRFTEAKNFSLLICAFSLIAEKYPDVILKIFGEGKLRSEYEVLIKSLGLDGRVQLPGFTDNIYKELCQAGLFVLSSDFEGIPNALIEAMSVGLPCVATDCSGGGARLLIKDNQNGLLVPVRNPEKMAEAMKKILGDKDFADNLSEQAIKIRNEYSQEIIYAKWSKFLIKVINEYNSKKGSPKCSFMKK